MIWELFRSRALALIAGLAMAVGGVWFSALSTRSGDTFGLLVGGVFTAVGGALLSWESSSILSRSRAIRDVNERIAAVSQNLAQSATRIQRAVEQAQAQQMDSTTTLALIAQATTMIYGQIDQIQRLIGQDFDSDAQMSTVEELEKLERKLDRDPEGRLSGVREDVARILALSKRDAASESVDAKCPECGKKNLVTIGTDAGSTSGLNCSNCGQRFNVHRASTGDLFTRALQGPRLAALTGSGSSTVPVLQLVPCGQCGTELRMRVSPNEKGVRTLVCLDCNMGNRVDVSSAEVLQLQEFSLHEGEITALEGVIPMMTCPTCSRSLKGILDNGSARFAFCTDDRTLMTAGHTRISEWRIANAGDSSDVA